MALLALPVELATRAYVAAWVQLAPGDTTAPPPPPAAVPNILEPVTPNPDGLGDVNTKATGLLGNLWWILLVFSAGYFLVGLARVNFNKRQGRYLDDDGNSHFLTAVGRVALLSIGSFLFGVVLKIVA